MASIDVALRSVPPGAHVDEVVVPLARALADHGVHANLRSMSTNRTEEGGDSTYALFPAGEMEVTYFTMPSGGGLIDYHYMTATVRKVAPDLGVTNEDIDSAMEDFKADLAERGMRAPLDGRLKVSRGGSIGGGLKVLTSVHGDPGPPEKETTSGCYVATAVYGGYDLPQVRVLRRFRDQSLSRSLPGRWFVRAYYRTSPWLVRRVGSRRWFTRSVRPVLDWLTERLRGAGYSDGAYEDSPPPASPNTPLNQLSRKDAR